MNAPQDAWAGPLALRMISRYRTQALTYVKIDNGPYNEVTGTVVSGQTTFPAAGAVVRSMKVERNGVQQGHELEAWVDHKTVPWPITSSDHIEYLGRRWKVVEIESYGSGSDGSPVGPVYLSTLDGKTFVTLNGKVIVLQSAESQPLEFTMYASKVVARAE